MPGTSRTRQNPNFRRFLRPHWHHHHTFVILQTAASPAGTENQHASTTAAQPRSCLGSVTSAGQLTSSIVSATFSVPMSSKKNRNSTKLMSTFENLGGAINCLLMSGPMRTEHTGGDIPHPALHRSKKWRAERLCFGS